MLTCEDLPKIPKKSSKKPRNVAIKQFWQFKQHGKYISVQVYYVKNIMKFEIFWNIFVKKGKF